MIIDMKPSVMQWVAARSAGECLSTNGLDEPGISSNPASTKKTGAIAKNLSGTLIGGA